MVLTLNGAPEPIKWIGNSHVRVTPGRRNAATPVIVHKGALADNVPPRDLRLTKGHSLYLEDVLIPVECLVNHRSIVWDDRTREIDIYHIELARHAVLIANGAPAESYRDDGNRWIFQNADERWDRSPTVPCAPLMIGGPLIDAVWRRLLDRSGSRPGVPITDQPDLHLLMDGRRFDRSNVADGTYRFRLPHASAHLRVVSRSGVPAELGTIRDGQPLGVALRRIIVRTADLERVIEASDASLSQGFHGYEEALDLRWTDGDATLPETLFADVYGPCEFELHVACTAHYPLFDEAPVAVTA